MGFAVRGAVAGLCLVAACGGDETTAPLGPGAGGGGGSSGSLGGSGGDASGGAGGQGSQPLTVVTPAGGAEVLWSAALRFAASEQTAAVFVEHEPSGASCTAPAPYFECLLDLAAAEPGPLTLAVTALAEDDVELEVLSHALTRREVTFPCTGDDGALSACIIERANGGESAGFEGVSYLNADDTHANANTSSMTGIDHQILTEPPSSLPAGVRMGVVNESRSWSPAGGWCSMPRCNASLRRDHAMSLYAENMFFFWPEHRDHGLRDYYMWQVPFFALSQGSSGSELDEVVKLLRALAIMRPEARDAAESAKLLGPIMTHLLLRSRVDGDLAYLTTDAFPTALANLQNSEALLSMAAAMRADELLPAAAVADHEATFPDDWSMLQALASPQAIGYAPFTEGEPPAGSFAIEVDLSATFDANDRTVLIFPAVLRDGGDVAVERLDAEGRRWRVTGAFPQDHLLLTNGIERTVARSTVAFFPHNGVWLGPPAMVSVGGHPAEETAPNSNDAD